MMGCLFPTRSGLQNKCAEQPFSRAVHPSNFWLDWALGCEWNPQRFFEALQGCLGERRIVDHNGILCSPELSNERG